MDRIKEILHKASEATASIRMLSDETVSQVLREVAEGLRNATETILAANAKDLARMSPDNPKYDRLKLTPERLDIIASDMENVAGLPIPSFGGFVERDRRFRRRRFSCGAIRKTDI